MQSVQLASQTMMRPVGIPAGNVFRAAKAPVDSVCFGASAKLLTDAEKLAKTKEQALSLFLTPDGKPKSREALVKSIQEHFKGSVEVFDGAQPDNQWVNQTLDTMGNLGMFNPSDTLLYPNDTASHQAYTDPENLYPARYVEVSNEIQAAKKAGLFLHANAPTWVLYHETFHALQFANGLPMGANSVAVQKEAAQFRDDYNQSSTLVGNVFQAIKRMATWGVQIPFLVLTRGLPKAEKDSAGDTPAKALRNEFRREMEVDRFLLGNGHKLGIGVMGYVNNAMHFAFESSLQYFRSLALD